MLTFEKGGFQAADAHIRRITLNLMRHAASCPPDVAVVADKLADARWDWNALTPLEAEVIFTFVTQETADAAVREFYADTTTIHDLGRDAATADGEYIDDDGDTHCPLCGYKHIRWGFVVRNDEGGRLFRCGSSCVIQYGLRVDGEATAEAALKKLNAAIARLQHKANREDWQAEHPDHVAEMAIVAKAERLIGAARNLPWKIRKALMVDGQYWDVHFKGWATAARATAKYYKKHGFLTALRTEWLYADGGLSSARRIVHDYEQATSAPEGGRYAAAWKVWFALNPLMNAYQRAKLTRSMEYGDNPDSLPDWLAGLKREVEARNRVTLPPPPVVGLRDGYYMADDLTDLPF